MKYKLIKKLPFENSPEIGYISKTKYPKSITHPQGSHYWCGNWFSPENYPEFWEEVVEKDYEILSLRSLDIIEDLENNETINMLLKQGCSIHSVKRLSDGEIFSIGNKVFSEYVNYTINKIDIVNDKCMVSALYDTNNPNGSRLHYNLNNIKKAKKPLFTTEDGVDIYEGESYYELITPDFHNKPCIWNILPTKTRGNINYNQEGNRRNGRIWFSTKEKAEEYILMNKPCLSLKEIYDLTDQNSGLYNESDLEKLVKQKLNK